MWTDETLLAMRDDAARVWRRYATLRDTYGELSYDAEQSMLQAITAYATITAILNEKEATDD